VETEVDRDEGLEAYFMGCSTNVDVKELAVSMTMCTHVFVVQRSRESLYIRKALINRRRPQIMGATIANKGKNPKTKKQVLEADTAQSISSVMMSCGMYNGAGNWMMDVGLPAKSGVSGLVVAQTKSNLPFFYRYQSVIKLRGIFFHFMITVS
jgi:glutaminase